MTWRGTLGLGCVGGSLVYVLYGKFGSPVSQILLAGLVLLLLVSTLDFLGRVERRQPIGLLVQAVVLWSLTWFIEWAALDSGFAGWTYLYNRSHPLSWGLAGVPVVVPTVWLAFGWAGDAFVSSLMATGWPGRKSLHPAGKLLIEGLACGWVFLSIDAALEWHFSSAAGFWRWERGVAPGAAIAGVPVWNFLLWFAIGFLVPLSGRLVGHGTKRAVTENWESGVRIEPALGLGALLAAGAMMNIFYGVREGALLCALSLSMVFAVFAPAHFGWRRGLQKAQESSFWGS
jgi:hypothetical protein